MINGSFAVVASLLKFVATRNWLNRIKMESFAVEMMLNDESVKSETAKSRASQLVNMLNRALLTSNASNLIIASNSNRF